MLQAFPEAGILVAYVDPTHKGGLSVDNGHFPVIALVEPGDSPAEGRRVERQASDAAVFQSPEVGAGGVEAADIVVDEKDLHSPRSGVNQLPGERAADGVVPDDVELQVDLFPGLPARLEQRREKTPSLIEQLHPVSGEGNCPGVPPEGVEEPRGAEEAVFSFLSDKGHG